MYTMIFMCKIWKSLHNLALFVQIARCLATGLPYYCYNNLMDSLESDYDKKDVLFRILLETMYLTKE